MHALACRATVSTKWTHEVPKASANIHLSDRGVWPRKREEGGGGAKANMCSVCQQPVRHLWPAPWRMSSSVQSFLWHTLASLLATCPFYIQRSIIQCAAAPCNAATLATTCHCLLHNCRHLAGINYSLPRLTRCLIRKRM